jgi:hypothetical protein
MNILYGFDYILYLITVQDDHIVNQRVFDCRNSKVHQILYTLDIPDDLVVCRGAGSFSMIRAICSYVNGYCIAKGGKIRNFSVDIPKEQFMGMDHTGFEERVLSAAKNFTESGFVLPLYYEPPRVTVGQNQQ